MKFRAPHKSIQMALLLCLSLVGISQSNSQDRDKQLDVTEALFKCLTEMSKVSTGAFFVDNILGNVDATLAVANSTTGGEYPAGSLVSLIPSEVMIKHEAGWNPQTNDWEFFELNVSEQGSEIGVRGTTEVVNQFGGNCFDCHSAAERQYDLVCETGHGCAALPVPTSVLVATQDSDPRCN
jgi:hypothetical protein